MFQTGQNPFRAIGAFSPSFKPLALAMCQYVNPHKKQKILEVGAGIGSITKHLVELSSNKNEIDIVEIMPAFAKTLNRRFTKYDNVNVYEGDILAINLDKKYDVIVSSLPFNSLPAKQTSKLIDCLVLLANNNAMLSFFEYDSLSKLVSLFLSKKAAEKYSETRKHIEKFIADYETSSTKVRMNIPPALVHYLRIKKNIRNNNGCE